MKSPILFLAAATVVAAINVSCSDSEKKKLSQIETIEFNCDQATKYFNLATIVDTASFETIALETNDDCLIGQVSKMLFHNDTIIIVDKITKSIFLFDDKGKFLSKICRVGRGPQEYLDLTDACVGNDHILVIDNNQRKIFCYNFNGKYRYGFEAKEGWRITECDGKIFVATAWGGGAGWNDHKMAVYDTLGNIVEYYIKTSEDDKNRIENSGSDYFIKKKNGFEFLLHSKNIIYSYNNGQFAPSYRVSFGEYDMPDEIAQKGVLYVVPNNLHKKFAMGVDKIMYWNRYRFISAHVKDDIYYHIYDSVEKTSTVCSHFKLDDLPILAMNGFINGDYLYYYYDREFLNLCKKEFWAFEPPQGYEEKIRQAAMGLADDDNGLIIRIKIKD